MSSVSPDSRGWPPTAPPPVTPAEAAAEQAAVDHLKHAIASWRAGKDGVFPETTRPNSLWERVNDTLHSMHMELAQARTDTTPPPLAPVPPMSPPPPLSPIGQSSNLPRCFWKTNRERLPMGQRCEDLSSAQLVLAGSPSNFSGLEELAAAHHCERNYLVGVANSTCCPGSDHAYNMNPNAHVDGSELGAGKAVYYSRCTWVHAVRAPWSW